MSSERVAVHIRAEDCGAGREERPGPVIPWQDYAPGWALLGFMAYVFVVRLFDTDRMLAWRVSREALGEGHLATLQMHMFAHASALHLAITAFAFVPLAALAVHRLGGGLCAWLRLGLLFEASGLAGGLAYLALHRAGGEGLLGASGVVFGLIGFLARHKAMTAGVGEVCSVAMGREVLAMARTQFWAVCALGGVPVLFEAASGLAWEAHLGGFVTGFLLAPALVALGALGKTGACGEG
ncbi:rhomboid family intramembrane serine protease [Novosphingobium decolorationis]|uniref:Rhomboid family intramembrane serine protease n=1 Tax=Novosphingobium decolorationis TaxID=2698673 RepID=A0ABX8E5M9_9SPHN|nr:rhomboid family intramembrane serine protease [Novosphingobium decolorationis]QVM84233.1 rhomboid family intramembrane serine protease [Novosphingobium decolorationis]